MDLSHGASCAFSIVNCNFHRNQGSHLSLLSTSSIYLFIIIEDTTFITSNDSGVLMDLTDGSEVSVFLQGNAFIGNALSGLYIQSPLQSCEITGCTFSHNHGNGAELYYTSSGLTSKQYIITECSVQNNSGTGMVLNGYNEPHTTTRIQISKINFLGNLEALKMENVQLVSEVSICECNFTNHRTNSVTITGEDFHSVILKKSFFKESGRHDIECSVLFVSNTPNLTLSDVNITGNDCTGISLSNSIMNLRNTVNLVRNSGQQGGAISLVEGSKLNFALSSKLNIFNNTAETYGGGIYSDETCEKESRFCFFEFGELATLSSVTLSHNYSKVFFYSGNIAKRGGDVVFGGCLSNCDLLSNGIFKTISKCDLYNTFWKLQASSTKLEEQSTFVDYPKNVVFCKNESLSSGASVNGATCKDSHSISVFRGQTFMVPLMVADDCCFPSVEVIEARINQDYRGNQPLQFKQDTIQKARKYCHNFAYALTGGIGLSEAAVTFTIQQQYFTNVPPVTLTVLLKNCPTGYAIDTESGECSCHSVLKLYGIECNPSNLSIQIPAQTWVGELEQGLAVQKDCQYCKVEQTQTINLTRYSQEFQCNSNRTGIMCGACVANYSLQLGGYECARCSNSTYKGILLLVGFTIIGIILVLLLLGLNLTVSTGMINGLIFYSNIVYLNSDTLLPITREGKSTHLQNTVRILSTFQAWMNLDFGIVTCFFDGYNTYISTWMQFVFPLYIWFLILIIVLASRYSSRISNITTSNTVSVLATLLLLSYAKLLKTSVESFSPVQLQILDGHMTRNLWKPDANIPYLGHLHSPLFLMSLMMATVYVIPFTLLILLGPLLQANSHYRFLHWINKLKPFLDAFYGPYTSRYRYWPGILLLSRLVILGIFAFYSPNDITFKLLTVTVMAAALLASWMAIGRIKAVPLYQKKLLNYLELFILLNMLVFAATSIYATQFSRSKVRNQQALAVVMVSGTVAAFCGILGYQIFNTASRFKPVRELRRFVPINIKKQKISPEVSQNLNEDISTKTTHTLVDITGQATSNDQLREPLLASDVEDKS